MNASPRNRDELEGLGSKERAWVERLGAAYRPEPMSSLERSRFERRVRRAATEAGRPSWLGPPAIRRIAAAAMLAVAGLLLWIERPRPASEEPRLTSRAIDSGALQRWESQVLQSAEFDADAAPDLEVDLPADYVAIESAFFETDDS